MTKWIRRNGQACSQTDRWAGGNTVCNTILQMYRKTNWQIYSQIDRQTDQQTDYPQMYRKTNWLMCRQIYPRSDLLICRTVGRLLDLQQKDRQTDRQTVKKVTLPTYFQADRQRCRQVYRQTVLPTYNQSERQTDRLTVIQTNRHADRDRHTCKQPNV